MSHDAPCRLVLAESASHAPTLAHYLRGWGILAQETRDEHLRAAISQISDRSATLLEVIEPRIDLTSFLVRLADLLPGLPLDWVGVGGATSALILVRNDEPASTAFPFLDFLEVAQLLGRARSLETPADAPVRRRRRWLVAPPRGAHLRRGPLTPVRRITPRDWS